MPEGKGGGSGSREGIKKRLLEQGWEEVRHEGKVIGYLNPSIAMSHPVYSLEQAWAMYKEMNRPYGETKLPWEA